jgi:hypothetical protein
LIPGLGGGPWCAEDSDRCEGFGAKLDSALPIGAASFYPRSASCSQTRESAVWICRWKASRGRWSAISQFALRQAPTRPNESRPPPLLAVVGARNRLVELGHQLRHSVDSKSEIGTPIFHVIPAASLGLIETWHGDRCEFTRLLLFRSCLSI